ncbi:MAG TPA: hypothetical protein VFA12_01465 [Stellaceae bacterium]|nr:hypothetical protein [Stellaceae bacterium]
MRTRIMLGLAAAAIAFAPLAAIAENPQAGAPDIKKTTTMSARQGDALSGQAALAAVKQHSSSGSTFSYHGGTGAILTATPSNNFAANHHEKLLH